MHRTSHATLPALSAGLLLAAAPSGAQAQEEAAPAEPTVVPVGEITVTAPRLETPLRNFAGSIEVIGRQEIQKARQNLSLDEPLKGVPGVFTQNRYNFAQDMRISIRGFGARAPFGIRGVQMVMDGIPLSLPDGSAQVDTIALDAVDRIEVIRGPSSSLYGNASGGVVNLSTMEGPPTPFIEMESQFGSFGFNKETIQLGGDTGRVNYAGTFSHMQQNGFRDHSASESWRYNTKVRFDITPTSSASVIVRGVDSPQAQDPGGLTRAQVNQDRSQASPGNLTFNAGEEVRQQTVGVVYDNQLTGNQSLRLRGFSSFRDFNNRLPFMGGGQVEFDRVFGGGGALYTLEHGWGPTENRLLVGLDGGIQQDDRQRYNNLAGGIRGAQTVNQVETVSNVALFLRDELSITDRLTLTTGVRYDRITFDLEDDFLSDGDQSGNQTLEEVSPSAGVTYEVSRAFIPFANVATSFETPTTTEFQPCTGGGFRNLEPEEATNYEVGARGQVSRIRYSLAAFHINTEQELISQGCPGRPGRSFFVNAGKTTRNGVEASLEAEVMRGLRTQMSYTYSDFEFDEFRQGGTAFDGNLLPGVPRHQAHAGVSYRHPTGVFAAFDATYTGDFFANDGNTAVADEYVLGTLRGGWTVPVGQWELEAFAGINNLFDQEYNSNVRVNAFGGAFYEPAPDRNYYGGIRVRRNFGVL